MDNILGIGEKTEPKFKLSIDPDILKLSLAAELLNEGIGLMVYQATNATVNYTLEIGLFFVWWAVTYLVFSAMKGTPQIRYLLGMMKKWM
jgi:hypothetical protein